MYAGKRLINIEILATEGRADFNWVFQGKCTANWTYSSLEAVLAPPKKEG